MLIYKNANLEKIVHPELSYKIAGLLFKTHNQLGRFCNEKQYGDFIEKEIKALNLTYEREKVLSPSFEDEHNNRNKVDFLIENKIVLEIKAKRVLGNEDYYQVKRYLVALNQKLGILVNFRRKYINPKRILNSSAKEWTD